MFKCSRFLFSANPFSGLSFRSAVLGVIIGAFVSISSYGQGSKHGDTSLFPNMKGRMMAGYQAWFRCPGDGSGRGWVHWGAQGRFSEDTYCTVDYWPDVAEYEQTYGTDFKLADGSAARVFSSYDYSTVDTHFRWMQESGVDGVFLQRFFATAADRAVDTEPLKVVNNVRLAAEKYDRAFAIMYDLSGLRPGEDDCSTLIADWKRLVDDLQITNRGGDQSYLYHDGKPLVAIWGVGFPDRPYDIRNIALEEFIDFLKNDPEYGGCAVMLGVPCYFRELHTDSVSDPYLHTLIESADIVMPWMVLRFSTVLHAEVQRYFWHVYKDKAWCDERGLDYVPVVYPGMSWHNLSIFENRERQILNAVPRLGGYHYWALIDTAVNAGVESIYVAMFDEVDEGTAIFKCTDNTPVSARWKFGNYEGAGSEYYLKLTGMGGELLREKLSAE